MAKAVTEVRCAHCKGWFPSPIDFGNMGTFDASTLVGNLAQCPRCGKMTGFNKENLRVRAGGDEGFVGSDT